MIDFIPACNGNQCDWPTCVGCRYASDMIVFECDNCKCNDAEELYRYGDWFYCKDCLFNTLEADEVIFFDPDDIESARYKGAWYDEEDYLLDVLIEDKVIEKYERSF